MTPDQEARMRRRLAAIWEAVQHARFASAIHEAMLRAYRAGYSDGRQDGAATGGEA